MFYLSSAIEYDAERAYLRPFPSIRSVFPPCFCGLDIPDVCFHQLLCLVFSISAHARMGAPTKRWILQAENYGKESMFQQNMLFKTRKEYFSVIHSLASSLFCPFPSDERLLVSAVESLIYRKSTHHWQRGFYPPDFCWSLCVTVEHI